jgi:hypothetical protein
MVNTFQSCLRAKQPIGSVELNGYSVAPLSAWTFSTLNRDVRLISLGHADQHRRIMTEASRELHDADLRQRDRVADGLDFRAIFEPVFDLRDVEAFGPATQVKWG